VAVHCYDDSTINIVVPIIIIIIIIIYLNGICMDSVDLSVCPRQLESMGDFYSSKLQRVEY